VRGDATAQVVCEWKRRWPTDENSSWQCVTAQFLVTFGRKSISDEVPFTRDDIKGLPLNYQEAAQRLDFNDPAVLEAAHVVKRAGMSQVRVMAYHIESSKGGRAHQNVREYLKAILRRCAEVQVDLLFCDGNLAASRNQKSQNFCDIPNSTICQSYRQFHQLLNEEKPLQHRMAMTVFDNNPAHLAEVEMDPAQRDQVDWDCCIAAVFGWGKTAAQRADRIRYSTDAAHVAKRLGLDNVEMPLLHTLDYEVAPKDWHAAMSERALSIDRRDLWLGGNDCDYHRPMFITIRNFATKNFRYRAAAKIEERKQKQKEKKGKGKGQSKGTSSSSSTWDSSTWAWTAASWYASSTPGARGESTEKDDNPHTWNVWDTVFFILFLAMMLNTLFSISSCVNRFCVNRNRHTPQENPPQATPANPRPPSKKTRTQATQTGHSVSKMYHFHKSDVVHHETCHHVRNHANAEKFCIGRQCSACGR
jgi:hypothetical protein